MIKQLALAASLLLMTGGSASAAECAGKGAVGFLCSTPYAEDLVPVPDTNWIVTSGVSAPGRAGALHLIDRASKTGRLLFGKDPVVVKRDERAFPGCPGVVDLTTFSASGVNLRKGRGGIHTLYVMNHQLRIEAFELDARKSRPIIAWKGCVTMPAGALGNSIAPLPNGGLAVTFMAAAEYFGGPGTTVSQQAYTARYRTGEITGHVATWSAASGWKKVPGTEASGPNGIEASADGRWLWIANWPTGVVVRAPLFKGGKRSVLELGVMPDNVRWGDDGKLYAAGSLGARSDFFGCFTKPGCRNDYGVARIDPQSMTVSLVPHPDTRPELAFVTSALKIGGELWLAGFMDDRVGYFGLAAAEAPAR